MKFFIFLLFISHPLIAKSPQDYVVQYFDEFEKIEKSCAQSILESNLSLLSKMKSHLASEQKQGKLKQVLSLRKFIAKLESGQYFMEGFDLMDSPTGQKIFNAYQKEIEMTGKLKVVKQERLLSLFTKAMNRKVVELTRENKIEQAIAFQKLAEDGPGKKRPVIVKRITSVNTSLASKSAHSLSNKSLSGKLLPGYYQASVYNEKTSAFYIVEEKANYLIRLNPKKVGAYRLGLAKAYKSESSKIAAIKNGELIYIFLERPVIPIPEVVETFEAWKAGDFKSSSPIDYQPPVIRKITDAELRSLPEEFRIR